MKKYKFLTDRKTYLTVLNEVELWNKQENYNDGGPVMINWEDHKDFEGYGSLTLILKNERALFWIGYLSGIRSLKSKGL